MFINYWDCEYHDYDEIHAEDELIRIYACSHPQNMTSCEIENKWGGEKAECNLLRDKGQSSKPKPKPKPGTPKAKQGKTKGA